MSSKKAEGKAGEVAKAVEEKVKEAKVIVENKADEKQKELKEPKRLV